MKLFEKLNIDSDAVMAETERLILEIAIKNLPSDEKMDFVVEKTIRFLDDQIEPKNDIAEKAVDAALDYIVEPFLRLLIQKVYDEIKARGDV